MKEAPQTHQIQHDLLIDRLIRNLEPTRRLWPVGARLALWLLLEIAIMVPLLLLRGYSELSVELQSVRYLLELGVFAFTGIAAANLALRSAIPGREATRSDLILLSAGVLVGVSLILAEPAQTDASVGEFIRIGSTALVFDIDGFRP